MVVEFVLIGSVGWMHLDWRACRGSWLERSMVGIELSWRIDIFRDDFDVRESRDDGVRSLEVTNDGLERMKRKVHKFGAQDGACQDSELQYTVISHLDWF